MQLPPVYIKDADPHDTINKLRAHAESAHKIGNTKEAEAFHAKANSMVEKHGEPKTSEVSSKPKEKSFQWDAPEYGGPFTPRTGNIPKEPSGPIHDTFLKHGFKHVGSSNYKWTKKEPEETTHFYSYPEPVRKPRYNAYAHLMTGMYTHKLTKQKRHQDHRWHIDANHPDGKTDITQFTPEGEKQYKAYDYRKKLNKSGVYEKGDYPPPENIIWSGSSRGWDHHTLDKAIRKYKKHRDDYYASIFKSGALTHQPKE